MRPLQSFGSLFVLASLALTLPLLGGCAVEADPSELTTVPSIEPIAVEGQRAKTLTCPAGSSLCKTVCCPTGSFCTILRDGTELCQVSPIDPKLSSVSSTSTDSTSTLEKTRDGGSTQPYLQIKLNDIFISSY